MFPDSCVTYVPDCSTRLQAETRMRTVPIVYEGGRALTANVAAALQQLRTLGDVMAWGRAQAPPRAPAEIITQDEYTHDVVLELGSACWLVFDTT